MPKAKSSSKKTVDNKKRLILLDAHAIIHRAYHALPEFATASGEPTGALYGLSAMLIKIIEDLKPEYIVACFDLPEPTHRHEAYEAYKAGRAKTDEALVGQLERAKDLFRAWGIPIYSCPGFEADDIIGTIAEETREMKDLEVIIASGDMDTMQLVEGKRVQVFTLKRGLNDTILYDEKKVIERFGFGPLLLPDFKGLRGDPSDNIIGVKGIGEKTATTLITTFGSLDKIYKALKKGKTEWDKAGLTDRMANLLIDNQEEANFSKTLAEIRRDAPVNFKLPDPWQKCLDFNKLQDFFVSLEFRTMPERVKKILGINPTSVRNANSAGLTRASGAPTPDRIAVADSSATTRPEPSPESNPEPSDAKELALALWVIDSNLTDPSWEDVLKFTKAKTPEEAREIIYKELEKREVKKVFEEIEKPLIPIVEKMNVHGVKIDRKMLSELSSTYHRRLSELEKSIWKDAEGEFNINSPKQLGEVIFVKLGLAGSRQKKTPTGSLSTKESELEKLKDKHPIINNILEYRELQKLLSTYIDSIPKLLDKDSRLHSRFIPAGTTTGRMASIDPNLQNIPIKSSLGQAIRHAFVAPEGFTMLSLDYSQIELRIAAILSKDKKLMDIFKKGKDVHTGVAAQVFGVSEEEVTKEMRRKAKVINFGVLFGMGVSALKVNLGCERKEAQEFYNNYFETFKELSQYLDHVKAETERTGFTETMFGRRRYFAGIKSPLPFIRAAAERMAINAPIQGTEADIVKMSLIRIEEYLRKNNLENKAVPLLVVHDELVYEVKESLVKELAEKFKEIMEEAIPKELALGVPIVAEASYGSSWGNMKTV
ncbi:MAG: DNA polymerase [Parcubacteria group bacterium]